MRYNSAAWISGLFRSGIHGKAVAFLFCILPALTFFLLAAAPDQNFSVAGNLKGNAPLYYAWGVALSIFGSEYVSLLLRREPDLSRLPARLMDVACILTLLTISLPITEDGLTVSSRAHSVLARISPAVLILSMVCLVIPLCKRWPGRFVPSLIFLAYSIAIALMFICFVGGATSLTELFCVLALQLLLMTVDLDMQSNGSPCIAEAARQNNRL